MKNSVNPNEGRTEENRNQEQKTNSKIIYLNLIISIITLYLNSLNSPLKSQRLSDWIQEIRYNYMPPTRNTF